MATIKYQYALNECGKYVNIKDVRPDERYVHKYYCLNCRSEMIPRLGNKRTWHFAHSKEDGHCGTESYLHKLAKLMIKEKFDKKDSFIIEYHQDIMCSDLMQCPFAKGNNCHSKKPVQFNLKKFYDECREEQAVGNYIADLLLSSSTNSNRKPVLIEIHVTHKSTEAKCKSGLRIIEIRIKNEEDINKLLSAPIVDNYDKYNRSPGEPMVRFIGFKEKSLTSKPLKNRNIPRFYLFRSGKAHVSNMDDFMSCRDVYKKNKPNSIFEASIDYLHLGNLTPFDFGYVAARQNGIQVKTCRFCKYHKNGYEIGFGASLIFCCMYKKYGTPMYPEPPHAKECEYYCEDKARIDEITSQMPTIVVAGQEKIR